MKGVKDNKFLIKFYSAALVIIIAAMLTGCGEGSSAGAGDAGPAVWGKAKWGQSNWNR